MSRFNNPRALKVLGSFSTIVNGKSVQGSGAGVFPSSAFRVSPEPTVVQQISFVLVCLFVLSVYANDIASLMFGTKAYISTVCLFLVPIAYLVTGTPLRSLRSRMGVFWLAFGIWLILDAPFSVWRGGTFSFLINYVPRTYLMLFYITACTISIRQCRKLLYALNLGAFLVLLDCFKFGDGHGDRFTIPDSSFFSNSNELALQLALGIAYMTFFFFTRSRLLKALGVIGISLSLQYVLKTGSRGVFLAIVIMAVIIFLYSHYKIPIIAGGLSLLAVALVVLPAATRNRLLFIKFDSAAASASDETETSALESQQQRERLLRMSIALTFQHPLFGVGPDEFMVAAAGESEKKGARGEWRGTHNSYTEVSSEAGLPAFFFYTAAVFLCVRANFRRYRRASAVRGLGEIAGLSFSLFSASLVYAVATIFFHIAYNGYLPTILGLTIALEFAAQSFPEATDLAGNGVSFRQARYSF